MVYPFSTGTTGIETFVTFLLFAFTSSQGHYTSVILNKLEKS